VLQRQEYTEFAHEEETSFLQISHVLDLLRRRAWYFIVPFILLLGAGSVLTFAWPARYLAQGKILVSSQEIPKDLVRPTVATLANERIQVIQQRIMTRDNLLALNRKFHLSTGWEGAIKGTDIVDFIRQRTQINPLELSLPSERKDAIAFTVGFDYENPLIATKVANELLTMILGEDVRTRTNFAAETTKFLERDVDRIEGQLRSIDAAIVIAARSPKVTIAESDEAKELAALKAQLVTMRAVYADSHPAIRALKRKIEALEKSNAGPTALTPAATPASTPSQGATPGTATQQFATADGNPTVAGLVALGLDALQTKRASLKDELNTATQKLAAARLGESLERGQHSERLEVIEQPTVPTKPVSPNRPKIFAVVAAFAMLASAGILVGSEALNPAVRRSADLASLIDSHLIVAIPNIYTNADLRRKRRRILLWVSFAILLIAGAAATVYFVLPPWDILFQKVVTTVFG